MAIGRPKAPLVLSAEERAQLSALAASRSLPRKGADDARDNDCERCPTDHHNGVSTDADRRRRGHIHR
jgi:hypothetical protein